MKSTTKDGIHQRIANAFVEYRSTVSLVEELIAKKTHVNEIILLVCARLDSLANAACQETTQKASFFKFLTRYSNHRSLLVSVSVPDLYDYFARLLWLLSGMIQKPGRLHLFDPIEDASAVSFIWKSELPVTEEHIAPLLRFVLRILRMHYRAAPGQPRRKNDLQQLPELSKQLVEAAASYKTQKYLKAMEAIGPILKDHTIGNLLYTDYRCAVIHDYGFQIDPALFFKETVPYYAIFSNHYIESNQFRLHFPAAFLLSLLKDCIDNYQKRLLHTLKLPSAIWFKICDALEEPEYLNNDTLNEGKDARLTI
ncbi:MAG: hypothetical protein A4E57_03073 [Syntrophorhabdaceae bacterium PtaU1.Bin034]|nr:MAG: hypothetical protein A4E57_03073 [Syntrophorhabdaceae bacterium PtaU1.Bin034]